MGSITLNLCARMLYAIIPPQDAGSSPLPPLDLDTQESSSSVLDTTTTSLSSVSLPNSCNLVTFGRYLASSPQVKFTVGLVHVMHRVQR